jgi:hypothetical protein
VTANCCTLPVQHEFVQPTTYASSVVLTAALPANAALIAAHISQGGCSPSGSLITCTMGSLAPRAAATATIALTPTGPGTLVGRAGVSAAEPDLTPANNAATVSTRVRYILFLPRIVR